MTATTLFVPQVGHQSSKSSVVAEETLKIIRVVAGGQELSINATYAQQVFQVPRQLADQELEHFDLPSGTVPVHSLAHLLKHNLGSVAATEDLGRILIAVEVGEQRAALRVQDVSTPLEIQRSQIHVPPRIVRPDDHQNMLTGFVKLSQEAVEQSMAPFGGSNIHIQDRLEAIVDPVVATGLEPAPHGTSQALIESVQKRETAADNSPMNAHTMDQVLAFVPDDRFGAEPECIYCLPLASVVEVVSVEELLPTPISAEHFAGYVYWRKRPIPVIRLGKVFGGSTFEGENERAAQRSRRLVLARTARNGIVGFFTSSQMQSIKTPLGSRIEVDELVDRPQLGVFETELGLTLVPDLDRILEADFSS